MRTLLLFALLVACSSAFFLKKGRRYRGGRGYGIDDSGEIYNYRPGYQGYSKGSIFGGYGKRRPCRCGYKKPYYVSQRPQYTYNLDSDENLFGTSYALGQTQGLVSTGYRPGLASTGYRPGLVSSGGTGYGVQVYRPVYSGGYNTHNLHGKYREKPHGFKISTNYGSSGYRPSVNTNYGYRGRTPILSSYSNYRTPGLLDSDERIRTVGLRNGLRTSYGSPPLAIGSDEDDVGIRAGYGGPTGQIQLTNIRSSDEN